MKKIKHVFLMIGLALVVLSGTGCGGNIEICGIFKECPKK